MDPVRVSGGPSRPRPRACCVHAEEVLVLLPTTPRMPHGCPQPGPQHKPWPSVHHTSIHSPRRIAVRVFYSQVFSPPPPPAFALGSVNLFVWLLGGTSVRLSSGGLMDVFQKMVILYDLSWNLF